MGTFKFDENSKIDYWVKRIIPVLIRWAQVSWDRPHYYSDLANAIGYKSNHLGRFLGRVDDVLHELDGDIPTLNGLVWSKTTELPGLGFEYVYNGYRDFSNSVKRAIVREENKKAHEYDWSWVLRELGLNSALILPEQVVEKQRENSRNLTGGESEAHKLLKEYVLLHPETIGIYNVIKSEQEYMLMSGDRVDVYFETKDAVIAVEVKSYISDENDVLRGIFQTIKYTAVLGAERLFDHSNKKVYSVLLLENKLSVNMLRVSSELNVKVIENYKIER